jgi:hypothetical protein
MLIAIRNRGMYSNAVYDPVFKSTTHRKDSTAEFFTADLNTGVIGCTEQYQFCNGRAKCSSPSALYSITSDFASQQLGYNLVQMAAFDTFIRMAYTMRIFSIQFMIDENVLLAKDSLYGFMGLATGLPERQWQIEVENLHNISMAGLQQAVIAHAAPRNPQFGQGANATRYWDWIVRETSPAQLAVCQNQKIRSQDYYSFSVLGLTLLFVAGVSVITLGLLAPCIANHRRRKTSRGLDTNKIFFSPRSSKRGAIPISEYRTNEWNFSDPLHLQRVALEEHGIAPWIETDYIPVPIEHQREFRIPWLTTKHGVTFWLENQSDLDLPDKSFQRGA